MLNSDEISGNLPFYAFLALVVAFLALVVWGW